MATKTISSKITLHVAGKDFKAFRFSDSGVAMEGKYDVVSVAPGNPVTLDADEADALIARGHAEDYVSVAPTAAPEPVAAPSKK